MTPGSQASSPPAAALAPPPAVVLSAAGLEKRYADTVALAGVDLAVCAGECFGLLGPNGAGKTTTVEIFEGLTVPDGGTVEVLGRRWRSGQDAALRQRLGIQLQETQLPDKLTVREVLRLFRSFLSAGHDVEEVIRQVGLEEKARARVGKLSGGQRQRLALACALVGDPEVLFLDEPTTGLDPQARRRIWELVEGFRRRGRTVLLTTHYMEEAERLCDRLAVLDHGRVIAEGTPQELIASLGADLIVELELEAVADGGPQLDELALLPGVSNAERRGPAYCLTVSAIGKALPALFALLERRGDTLATLNTHHATLEDVFVHLTGRALRDEQ